MTGIKLHYFSVYGKASATRMILHYNSTPFEDHIVGIEDWPALKQTGLSEFGHLPVLEIDGLKLVQSRSINRYLCQKFGYYPSNPYDVYLVESLCDLKEDILKEFMRAEADSNLEETLVEEKVPTWLKMIETRFASNPDNKHFVGEKTTLADFEIFQLLVDQELYLLSSPLNEFCEGFLNSSQSLQTYIKSRPNRQ